MTRNNLPASPTKPHSPSRAWRAIAAVLFSALLAPTAAFADATAPATPPAATAPAPAAAAAPEQNAAVPGAPAAAPAATDPVAAEGVTPEDETGVVLEEDNTLGMAHDLSPWGMYQNADIIVKIVMIGLAIASIITWTIWIAKGFELLGAKRRLRNEIVNLKKPPPLKKPAKARPSRAPWRTCWCTTHWKKCACRPTPAKKKASRNA